MFLYLPGIMFPCLLTSDYISRPTTFLSFCRIPHSRQIIHFSFLTSYLDDSCLDAQGSSAPIFSTWFLLQNKCVDISTKGTPADNYVPSVAGGVAQGLCPPVTVPQEITILELALRSACAVGMQKGEREERETEEGSGAPQLFKRAGRAHGHLGLLLLCEVRWPGFPAGLALTR